MFRKKLSKVLALVMASAIMLMMPACKQTPTVTSLRHIIRHIVRSGPGGPARCVLSVHGIDHCSRCL